MPVNIYSPLPDDGINAEEDQLYRLINEYRQQNGLSPIPLSGALTIVANRHVQDLAENIGTLTHAWSDAFYDSNNSSTWPSMWLAPQRLNTGYFGYGYEIAHGATGGYVATAESALNGWKSSELHNAVILNQGIWQDNQWKAIGIGLYKGYATVWFGEETDQTSPTLIGGQGSLSGNGLATEGSDNLQLSTGNDVLFGLGGNDTLRGGSGNDSLNGMRDHDQVFGEAGYDSVRGGKGNDIVSGDDGNDLVFGDLDNDQVYGGNDHDTLYGGKNEDLLDGGPGNDILYGDLGGDTSIGGTGIDTFVIRPNDTGINVINYNDVEDFIGLTGGLTFSSLSITQGTGANANNTLISLANGGLLLAILPGVSATLVDANDFVVM